MDNEVKSGTLFKHYKGRQYKFLLFAKDSETLEELVVYQAQYGCQVIWVRPKAMFFEVLKFEESEFPRFKIISNTDAGHGEM